MMIIRAYIKPPAIALALLAVGCHSVSAQEAESDSLSISTTMQEIVVEAPHTLQSGNRSIYYPNKELREAMTTSSQLLAGLQIPELIVNPANGNVAISGGGKLSIRINGRPASETELMGISSKDITKVEYISNPGTRYGDAAGVLDIRVKRRNDGYGVVLNLLQSPNRGWGDYTAALKYNTGRSEWSIDYHSNPMWHMDCHRNNSETINIPGTSTIFRREEGVETPNRLLTHRASLQYSYAYKSSLLFNVQARLIRQNDRYASTGTICTDSQGTVTEGMEKEVAPYSSWQGDLDLYLHWKINSQHKVYFNVVPTALTSASNRIYESEDLSISSRIDSRGWRMLAEGIWEGRIGKGMMSAGVSSEFMRSKAEYVLIGTKIHDNSFEGRCFVEWNHRLDKFRYIIGADCSLLRLTEPIVRDFTRISPRLSMSYTPFPWAGVNLSFDAATVNPASSQLNPVEQRIDRFQYSVGTLSLKPYLTYKSKLDFDFNFRGATARMTVADNYSRHPIMGGKIYAAGRILQSYYNSGFYNDFIIKGQIRTPVFTKQLTLSLEGGWHRMASEGVNYRHAYSRLFVNAQLIYMTGLWWFMVKYNNAYNVLWGEMISSVNNNLLNIGAGYRYKAAVFMAGIVNPIGNVSLKSRDLSSLAGYERTYHAASTNCLAWIGVSLNISHGNRRAATQKKIDNTAKYESIKNIQK